VLWSDDGLELRPHPFDDSWTDTIASNYRSVITTALITEGATPYESGRRLALLVDHAHGAASLANGQLELMLQRRLMQDDGLGMNEAMDERAPFSSPVWLLAEEPGARATLRKELAEQLNAVEPVPALTPVDRAAWRAAGAAAAVRGLASDLPPAIRLFSCLATSPEMLSSVVLRLAHAYAAGEDPEYSQGATLNLAELWAPPRELATISARGLTLNAPVFDDGAALPITTLNTLDVGAWVLSFRPANATL